MALSDRLKTSNFSQFATATFATLATDKPKQPEPQANDRLVKCGNCSSWQPIHPHGRGAGRCAGGVEPLALAHWSETLKNCEKWRAKK